jgi:uncharacterized protein (TIGR02001 family)
MNRFGLSTIGALVAVGLSASLATAADLGMVTKAPPPVPATPLWDIAFGGALATDYNFRGISQSDRGFSPSAYFEPRFNITPSIQLYAGIAGLGVKLPTDPTAEVDFYAGIRPTFGPLALDFGFIYYYYPRETQLFIDPTGTFLVTSPVGALGIFTLDDTDFWEVYAKGVYTFNDYVALGGNFYYSPNWLNTGAYGTFASGTLKLTAPANWLPNGLGLYLSGELGHYWFGTSDPILGSIAYPDYTTWNIGLGLTWKVFTLDLRYYDTDLSKGQCFVVSGDPKGFYNGGLSNWCSAAFVAKLSFDLTLASLK